MYGATILYIIGNGFDLHHEIKSSYLSYREWLKDNDQETLNEINEIYGHPSDPWWKSFEESLTVFKKEFTTSIGAMTEGQLIRELDSIDSDVFDEDFIKYGHLDKPYLIRRCAEVKAIRLVNKIKKSFSEWVNDIDIDKPASRVFKINPEENLLALVFNYTRSFEKIYGIDYALVNHIHGKVIDNEDDSDWYNPQEFIIGHGLSMDDIMARDGENPTADYSCFSHNETKGEDSVAHLECYSAIEDIRKPVDDLITSNVNFWDSLHEVNTVVVAGMSFSKIDEKYFQEVYRNVSPKTHSIVYCHTTEDKENAIAFMESVQQDYEVLQW